MANPVENRECQVAIVGAAGLGDCLFQMVVAHNLANNGYSVTLFSDFAGQFDDHIAHYRTRPFPPPANLTDVIAPFHIVLYDGDSRYVRGIPAHALQWLKSHAICYRVSSSKPNHAEVTADHLMRRLPADWLPVAERFVKFNRSLKMPAQTWSPKRRPIVEHIALFLQQVIGLEGVTTGTGLAIPAAGDRDATTVIIHPTSSSPDKNWSARKYLALFEKLEAHGFKPVVTVAPHEREAWIRHTQDAYPVPLFDTIVSLAQFYSTAGWFIGSDSGNAHLASHFGVPTLQIFPRWRTSPSWRAGWAPNRVLVARFPHCLSRKNWQQGLSVERVLRVFLTWVASLGAHPHRYPCSSPAHS